MKTVKNKTIAAELYIWYRDSSLSNCSSSSWCASNPILSAILLKTSKPQWEATQTWAKDNSLKESTLMNNFVKSIFFSSCPFFILLKKEQLQVFQQQSEQDICEDWWSRCFLSELFDPIPFWFWPSLTSLPPFWTWLNVGQIMYDLFAIWIDLFGSCDDQSIEWKKIKMPKWNSEMMEWGWGLHLRCKPADVSQDEHNLKINVFTNANVKIWCESDAGLNRLLVYRRIKKISFQPAIWKSQMRKWKSDVMEWGWVRLV